MTGVNIEHGETVCSCSHGGLGHLFFAVTVRIGFDGNHELGIMSERRARVANVAGKRST